MGRSVSHPDESLIVVFRDVSEIELFSDWEEFCEDLTDMACNQWTSLEPAEENKFTGRENHILAENSYVLFGVSEYCGLAAIWVAQRHDVDNIPIYPALAAGWATHIQPKFREMFGNLEYVGTMSNGEAVFQENNPIPDQSEGLEE